MISQTADIQMKLSTFRGFSAYEIALQNGFIGTESQWLQSLQGAPGADAANVTVNNKAAVDGNITLRGTDVLLRPGLATTVTQAVEAALRADQVVNHLASADETKVLSAAQGFALKQQLDAQRSAQHTVTLMADDWSAQPDDTYFQVASVPGMTANASQTSAVVTPSADRAQAESYASCGIRAVAQGDDTLTFSALSLPEDDVDANVLVVQTEVMA